MSNLLDKSSLVLTPTAYDNGKILSVKPNTSVGDFDFTRNSSATRVNSQGLIEDVQILSSNLVTNGDFSQIGSEEVTNGDFSNGSTDWSVVGLATISNGVASFVDNGTNTNSYINQNVFTVGKFYKVTFDVTRYVSGRIQLQVNTLYSVDISGGIGTYTTYVKSDNIRLLMKRDGAYPNYDFDIDNVSVKEVGQGWNLGTGWSIGNNKAIANNVPNLQRLQRAGNNPSVIGNTYKYSINISNVSGFYSVYIFGVYVLATSNTEGIIEGEFTATSTNGAFWVAGASASGLISATIENITILEITEDTNLPRIDYTGGVGHWLFEPQSTNLIPYSEDFTQWNKSNASLINTISSTVVSPDGVSYANKLYPIGSATSSYIRQDVSGNCFSVFFKKGERRWVLVYGGFGNSNVWFDSENGVFGNVLSEATATVESFGNDWYRIKILWTQNSSHIRIYNTDSGTSSQSTGNGTDGLYIWGAQLEVQSFATSYISTSGAISTRLQDAAFGAGSSDLINSTEGVLYAEIAALSDSVSFFLGVYGSSNSRVRLTFGTSGSIRGQVFNGSYQCRISSVQTISNNNKIALKYKQDDFALWINGVEVGTDTSGLTFSADTLTYLNLSSYDETSNRVQGKVKCVAVFKEALTDAELTCLTTI